MIAKINKVEESGDPACTASGIIGKTIFFLVLTLVGVTVFFLTPKVLPNETVAVDTYNINTAEAIIASLFLLVDFEVINYSIEAKLPKKYEWLSAFALSFSIIEIYIKIVNFILRLSKNKE